MTGDPLYQKYHVKTSIVLGDGADGGVVRGVDKDTGEWHALKFMSRDAYSPRKELEILSAMKHPNIIPCLGVYEPSLLLGGRGGCGACRRPTSICTSTYSVAGGSDVAQKRW
jgi:hypothetical protein